MADESEGRLAAPIGPGDRYEIIDIVRGFALFGVLLANMVLTTQFLALADAQREALPTARIDAAALFLTGTLIDGKFFTIFSMLFGLGFAVQRSRAEQRGVNVLPTSVRRLGILFVIGVLHGMLLWFGDVLHIYALLGFVLLLFRRRSDRTILAWSIGILLLVMLLRVGDWSLRHHGWDHWMLFGRELPAEEVFDALRHGSYADVVALNWATHLKDYGEVGLGGNILFWYCDILGKFLFGFVVGRRLILQQAAAHRAMFRRVLPWALVLGLGGSAVMNAEWSFGIGRPGSELLRVLLAALHECWVIALSIAYVCGLVLLHGHPRWRPRLGRLAPVGRMALTNYLGHSLCFIGLFYGVGLGLLGEVGTSVCILLSVAIFAAQIALSAWWLARYRFGPVEWLWRSLTYGNRQPFRNAARVDSA